MASYLIVGLGGAIGAMARFGMARMLVFPYSTFVVNVVGSFIMGYVFVYFSERLVDRVPLFFMTGVLGGFTTFSAFSLDALRLIHEARFMHAAVYIVATVALSLMGVFMGYWMAKGGLN